MNDYEIWFCISKLSYTIKNKLLYHFKNIENIWYYSTSDEKSDLMNEKIKEKLREAWDKEKITFIKNKIKKEKIKTTVITDDLYPRRLKEYDDSPYMLFYKGDIEKLNNQYNVSVVGARNCTNYGINVTNIICEHMCENNINIISGMARGIDSTAHRICINKDKFTCAILGSGIDVVYPKENFKLYNSIIKNGCVISQFLPGTKPYSYNFPTRNRIISALSDLVVVVEANQRSGSLITAGAALDQGKDVIVVPGNIFSTQSKGTNRLIKDGAYILTDIKDIYEILNIDKIKFPKKNIPYMNDVEKIVYKSINNTPVHFNEVLRLTKIDIKQLYEVLFELQLKNEIMCLGGSYYARNNKDI